MEIGPVLVILGSGLIHATWNLMVKSSEDRLIAVWGVFVGGAIALAPVSIICCTGDWSSAWKNVTGTGALHLLYLIGLARAYDNSDLSSAYPIARGVAPGLAAVGGVVFLRESLTAGQTVAVATIALGLLVIGLGANRRGTAYAVLTGATIALYSVIDSAGVRLHGDALGYTGMVFLSIATFQAPLVMWMKGARTTLNTLRATWPRMLGAGVLSVVSYGLALYVVRSNPVGPVIALREVSVVFGALMGWWFLGERITTRRWVGIVAVSVGALVLVAV